MNFQKRKEKWLRESLESIRQKNLKEPILIGKHLAITDLEKYLRVYEKSIKHNNNPYIVSVLCRNLTKLLDIQD